MVVSGVDRADNPWKLNTHVLQGGTVWQADLDNNGLPDLIFALFTGGNGWAPSTHLLFLMFDSQGRPIPWQVDGYFGTDQRGIEDLLDLNQDGHAELLRQGFDDGYWVTSLYRTQEARWQIVHGDLAGRTYPLYTRFTNRANHAAVTPMAGRSPREDDLSNSLHETSTPVVIAAIRWERTDESGNLSLTLSDGRLCRPLTWYSTSTVVIDRPSRRDAATFWRSDHVRQLLSEIHRRRLPVIIGGHRRNSDVHQKPPTDCMPEFIWAEDRGAPAHK